MSLVQTVWMFVLREHLSVLLFGFWLLKWTDTSLHRSTIRTIQQVETSTPALRTYKFTHVINT
jgi:hypothetical protein